MRLTHIWMAIALLVPAVSAADPWPGGTGTGGSTTIVSGGGTTLDAGSGPILTGTTTGTCPSGWFIDLDRDGNKDDGERCLERTNDIDVRDFGAACDGVTDDTTKIQAALDFARGSDGLANGRRVRIPGGTCMVSQILLKPGMWIEGESEATPLGTGASTFKQTVAAATANLDMFVDDPALPDNDYFHGMHITNLQFRGATAFPAMTGTGAGLRITRQRYAESSKFENLMFNSFGGPGMEIAGGCEPCYFENLHANGNGGPGIYIHRGAGDTNASVTLNHVSGDGNLDALITLETGSGNNGEHYVISGVKSECANGPQKYGLHIISEIGAEILVQGLSHRNCTPLAGTGTAAIKFEGGASKPRLVWESVSVDSTVDNWMTDGIDGAYTVVRTADSHWGVFGMIRGGSHLFEWTTNSMQTCGSSTKGAVYFDTSDNTLRLCDGTSYGTLQTSASVGVPSDATHVWATSGDDLQTACTALNTALDAANTDGWLYVWGGTHTVTAPLTCSGASKTERMHIICMGGPVNLDSAGNSGCNILPTADAAAAATVSLSNSELVGFHVVSDTDASDMAVKCTDSCIVKDSYMETNDSATDPATKYVARVDSATSDANVQFINNTFELACSESQSECDTNSSMLRVELANSADPRNNPQSKAFVKGNTFRFIGTTRDTPNKPAAIQTIAADDINITENEFNLHWPPNLELPTQGGNYAPLAYRTTRSDTGLIHLGPNAYRGAGEWGASGPFGIKQIWESIGGGGSLFAIRTTAYTVFDDNNESYGFLTERTSDNESLWQIAMDGDTEHGLGGTSFVDTQLQRRPNTNDRGVIEQQAAGPLGGALALDAGSNTPPNSCASDMVGRLFYDKDLKMVCVCDDKTGSYVFHTLEDPPSHTGTSTNCG